MGKLVVLTLGKGDFEQQGFPATLQIAEEGESLSTPKVGYLPPNAEILKSYANWQSTHRSSIRAKVRELQSKEGKTINFSINEFKTKVANLIKLLNKWLNSQSFSPILEELRVSLKPDDEIRFIIQAPSIQLWKLPWHLWDLFDDYPFAEIALSTSNYGQVPSSKKSQNEVRVLAILGDSEGIDIGKDRALLEELPSAETIFLPEPRREKVTNYLLKYSWDILFFAGHSQTEGESGRIFINKKDSLTIGELKEALGKSITKGLRLAIFNSCDGLGLAQALADLQIPQIIVMREPVPDLVAQEFLKYFLNAFANGKSLYLSVKEAREKMQYLEEIHPGVSWLPVICQNPSQLMPAWDQLHTNSITRTGLKIWNRKRNFKEYDVRSRLLSRTKNEVNSRWNQSLHNQVVIQLPKEIQPKQIERPWDVEVRLNHLPNQPLTLEREFINVFKQSIIAGKLLIVGNPGSGKTATLLELANQLIMEAEKNPDEPVPVLLNLSSWKDDKQAFMKWLIAEIVSKYNIRTNIIQQWLENRKLLPLLDGLDELKEQRQELCVQEINQFLESRYRPRGLVVCCREKEYGSIETKLKLNGAICLQPIVKAEVKKYFLEVNHQEIWQKIENSYAFLKLLESPLMLNFMALVGQEIPLEDMIESKSIKELEESVLDAYIEQMLKRETTSILYSQKKEPSIQKTQYWLQWLASKYQDSSQIEFSGFSLEQMQPLWLPSRFKQIYALGVGFIFGLSLGLIIGGIIWLTIGKLSGPPWGELIALATALYVMATAFLWASLTVGQASRKIELVETLVFSYKRLFLSLIGGLISGLITWKLSGMIAFLIVGLLTGLIQGVSSSDIDKIKIPNQSIWQSVKHAGLFALVGAIGMAIPAAFMSDKILIMIAGSSVVLQNKIGTVNVVLSAVFVGSIFGLTEAGIASIQHFTLRLILWWNGYIPWNYSRFLDYATERKLLQQIGGRYQFIHKLLQDRLAARASTAQNREKLVKKLRKI